jgi:hypothetical protein
MIKTSTYETHFNGTEKIKEINIDLSLNFNPSKNTISTILNYSKNLEIKQSQLIQEFQILKS